MTEKPPTCIRRFRNSNALNAFIGIDLRHYESGDYVANDHISKRGNTVARKILFKAIQNIASAAHYHPNHINDYYQRRKMDAGQFTTKTIPVAIEAGEKACRSKINRIKKLLDM